MFHIIPNIDNVMMNNNSNFGENCLARLLVYLWLNSRTNYAA